MKRKPTKATAVKAAAKATTAKITTAKTAAPAIEAKPAPKAIEEKDAAPVAKTTVTEQAAKKPAVKKAPAAAKVPAAKKPAVKKAPVKVAEPEVYVQHEGQEILTTEIVEKVKAAYVAEGHRASAIKSLKVYIKPEDYAAYYVINDKITGKVML